jgi:hypothetical protein
MTTLREVQSIECPLGHVQARSQGGASGCNVPTKNLDALSKNLQNIKDKYGYQPYYIHVLPLLNRRGWTTLFQKRTYMQDACTML